MSQFKATKIVKEEKRTLVYGHEKWSDYHIIAPVSAEIKIGDVVEYDPEGFNFGWFVRVLPTSIPAPVETEHRDDEPDQNFV